MNDRDVDRWDGPKQDELRNVLRQWRTPEPPPGIEDELRRTFRRRRPRRSVLGLAVAAGLVILLVTLANRAFAPRVRVVAQVPSSAPSAPAPVGPAAVTARPPSAPRALATRPRGSRRARRASHAEPVVVVEPGQAALLRQLARALGGARVALPAGAPPAPEVILPDVRREGLLQAPARDEVRPYRSEWKRIETEWPFVHRSL